MSQQSPRTITCPRCGNINAYDAANCLRCELALAPVRELLAQAADSPSAAQPTEAGLAAPASSEPREAAPPLPELQARPTTESIGTYMDSWRFLIRGMGDRANEIAARFFKQLGGRGIEGLKLSIGKLTIVGDPSRESRDYYFAERDLGKGAKATMAIRIAPVGTDLFVEWRHYVTPSKGFGLLSLTVLAILAIFTYFFGLLLLLYPRFRQWVTQLDSSATLNGFQEQDSTALQLAVRAALEEAIDLAGISKALIQPLSKEDGKDSRRVI
jgi:nitroreductase